MCFASAPRRRCGQARWVTKHKGEEGSTQRGPVRLHAIAATAPHDPETEGFRRLRASQAFVFFHTEHGAVLDGAAPSAK